MTNKKNISIKIDYLSMVFETATVENVIGVLLDLPPEVFVVRKAHVKHKTYTMSYEVAGITVFGNPVPTMENPEGLGCYLVMKGKGCNEYQKINASPRDDIEDEFERKQLEGKTFGHFFHRCHVLKRYSGTYHLTRIDIAIDDKNEKPYFTIEQITEKCKRGEFISRSRSFHVHESQADENGTAKTLYIGDRKSNQSYRFYDKDKQLCQSTGKTLEEIGSWKRTEIQLRDETAHAFSEVLRDNPYELGKHAFGILSESLRFVTPSVSMSNRSLWKTCRFWNRFLGDIKPLRLQLDESVNELEDTVKWLEKGGAISAIKAITFLEQHQALGEFKSVKRMIETAHFSPVLSVKLISCLQNQGRDDLIPLVHQLTRM